MDPRSDSKSSWLSALLAPVSVDEFLSRYWLKQHLFCRGAADRFSGLLSWTALNEILEHHWRETVSIPAGLSGPRPRACVVRGSGRIYAQDSRQGRDRSASARRDAVVRCHRRTARAAHASGRIIRGVLPRRHARSISTRHGVPCTVSICIATTRKYSSFNWMDESGGSCTVSRWTAWTEAN